MEHENLNTEKTANSDLGDVSGMLLDEATQNECWFQIVNTVEDMSNNPTCDEVIEHLKLNYMVVPRNY